MTQATRDAMAETDGGFQQLRVDPQFIETLARLGIDEPTAIQQTLIPAILDGKDCLALARPGDGKTNAYMLPIAQQVEPGGGPQALILQPTRALALQTARNLSRFAKLRDLRVATIVVQPRRPRDERNPLSDNPEIIVGTSRAVRRQVQAGHLDLAKIRFFVLDDADVVLDGAEAEATRELAGGLDEDRTGVVIAGERTDAVEQLADALLRDPVRFESSSGQSRIERVRHQRIELSDRSAFDALMAYCRSVRPRLGVVFAVSDAAGKSLAQRLARAGLNCRWIEDTARRRPPRRSDRRRISGTELVVASDPPPRQLATIPATHLLHFDPPADVEGYRLRIERCPRLSRPGVSVLLLDGEHAALAGEVEQQLGVQLEPVTLPERKGRRERGSRERSRRDGSDRRGRRSEQKPAEQQAVASAESAAQQTDQPPKTDTPEQTGEPWPTKMPLPSRFSEVLHRDEELERRGIRPQPRTLASRFRSPRARRRLIWEPDTKDSDG